MSSIIRNPLMCRGSPTLQGRRLTVYNVVSRVFVEGVSAYARDMDVREEDVRECLRYCANLECVMNPLDLPCCDGCLLSDCAMEAISANAREFMATGDPLLVGLEDAPAEHVENFRLAWLFAAGRRRWGHSPGP